MGLFGITTDELARRELEAKRKYASKYGVEVNANINDMKLNDSVACQSNVIKNYAKIYKYSLFLLFALLVVVIVLTVIERAIQPKPDYKGYDAKINAYLSQIGNVKNYRVSTSASDIYYISLDERTWKGSELDKVSYCDSIRKTFTSYGWDYNIIDKDDTIYVIFETEDGITLAEPNGIGFGKYNIYY